MRYASVCSGVGTCALAWKPLGWETVWFSEFERFPSRVLAQRFPEVVNHGDMLNVLEHATRRLKGEETSSYVDLDLDVLAGGTPCQAFSVAGNRLSLKDARGNLTLAFVQLVHAIDALRPGGLPVSVWENVPGVFSTADNAFGCFLGGLAGEDGPLLPPAGLHPKRWRTDKKTGRRVFSWPDAGVVAGPMRTVAWRVQDSAGHGLPQRRRRVLVVSCPAATGFRAGEILFERQRMSGDHPTGQGASEEAAGAVGDRAARGVLAFGGNDTRGPISVAAALNTNRGCHNPGDFEAGTLLVEPAGCRESQVYQCHGSNVGPLGTLRTGHNETNGVPFLAEAYRTNSKGEVMAQGDKAGALTTMTSPCAQVVMTNYRVRRFMPVECERLQGYPDNHTAVRVGKKVAQDGPRYRAVGNGWSTPVFAWLGRRITEALL